MKGATHKKRRRITHIWFLMDVRYWCFGQFYVIVDNAYLLALVLPKDWFLSKDFSAYHPNEITSKGTPKRVKSRTMGMSNVTWKQQETQSKRASRFRSFPFDVCFCVCWNKLPNICVGYHFKGLWTISMCASVLDHHPLLIICHLYVLSVRSFTFCLWQLRSIFISPLHHME